MQILFLSEPVTFDGGVYTPVQYIVKSVWPELSQLQTAARID